MTHVLEPLEGKLPLNQHVKSRVTEDSIGLEAASVRQLYSEVLKTIGEDPVHDGLLQTPERLEKSLAYLSRGIASIWRKSYTELFFDVDYDEMALVNFRSPKDWSAQ
jgi:GTP cyclohydrolase I